MPRLIAAILVILILVFGVVFIISRLTGLMKGRSEALGKILAAVIIATAAYALFGQSFLFGYMD
jgi:hypothetical protein